MQVPRIGQGPAEAQERMALQEDAGVLGEVGRRHARSQRAHHLESQVLGQPLCRHGRLPAVHGGLGEAV